MTEEKKINGDQAEAQTKATEELKTETSDSIDNKMKQHQKKMSSLNPLKVPRIMLRRSLQKIIARKRKLKRMAMQNTSD